MSFRLTCLVCIAGIVSLGFLSGWSTASSIQGWYEELEKPPGTPPDWVFGPVWTFLYAAMGVALARVLHFVTRGPAKRRALGWFGVQLALNLTWTPVFFGMQRPDMALGVIGLLLVAIAGTLRAILPSERGAAAWLVPYLLWVGYAAYLNVGFLMLNRGP